MALAIRVYFYCEGLTLKPMQCLICPNEIEQKNDGSGGYEIGLSKWFGTIEPWDMQVILCPSCFKKLAKFLTLSTDLVAKVNRQMPRPKQK